MVGDGADGEGVEGGGKCGGGVDVLDDCEGAGRAGLD